MKKYSFILLALLLLPALGLAQNIMWNFSPTSVEVNTMNTASFDPYDPLAQPDLTTLFVKNTGLEPLRADMKVGVYWNNNFLVDAYYQTKPIAWAYIQPGQTISLSNRDLITNIGNYYFESKGDAGISVSGVIDANPLLKKAVMAGYFPDGNLQLRVWLRVWEAEAWVLPSTAGGYQEFTIKIRNAGTINLISPGVAIGQNPPQVGILPPSFLWSSLATGINPNKLIIREFGPNSAPNPNTVANTGALFYQTPQGMADDSGFAHFLPFVPGNYYAWQVSTALSTEYEPFDPDRIRQNPHSVKSNWFIFQFSDSTDGLGITEFQAKLNALDNNKLLKLNALGYVPLGEIIYEGNTYRGKEALDLLDSLIGHDILVELKD
ncbi:MAG: hypothetical protein RBS43_02020 [Candidatus Cloacimonas sp.]|jgi:hypothetical protein|nr:hypothetical protein [Candidatus Cloacimonas sp.]